MTSEPTGRAALAVFVMATTMAAALAPLPAAAQAATQAAAPGEASGWRFTVGGGVFVGPDYSGSDDYEVRAAPVLKVQKDNFYIKTDGPGVRANVIPHGRFEFGPVLRYGGGRDDVEDAVVDRLPDVDDAFWVGVFAAYKVPGVFGERDALGFEVEAVEATSGDNGAAVKLGVDYGRQVTKRLMLGVGLSTSYVDGDYADTYFSVSAAGAAASGLARYDAGSGFRDATLSLTGRFAVTESIGVGAVAGVSRMLGDAADSPVVDDRGTATPVFGGAFVTYSF